MSETLLEPTKPAPASVDSATFGKAAAAAVEPDPLTAELLAKHAAGEKLTAPEYGKVGAWKLKLKRLFGGGAGASAEPAKPRPAVGPSPRLVSLAPRPASTEGATAGDGDLGPVPVDAALVQRTAGALLSRLDSIAVRYVGNAARRVGAEGTTLARLELAARLSKDDRALIVDLSPDVVQGMGLDPRHFPLTIVLGTLGLWGTDLWLAVQEIKALAPKTENGKPKVETDKP